MRRLSGVIAAALVFVTPAATAGAGHGAPETIEVVLLVRAGGDGGGDEPGGLQLRLLCRQGEACHANQAFALRNGRVEPEPDGFAVGALWERGQLRLRFVAPPAPGSPRPVELGTANGETATVPLGPGGRGSRSISLHLREADDGRSAINNLVFRRPGEPTVVLHVSAREAD